MNKTDNSSPSQRLEKAMIAAGLNDPQLASALNTTKQTIFKLRHGKTSLSSHWAKRISAVLNVSPSYLMGIDQPTTTKESISQGTESALIPEYDCSLKNINTSNWVIPLEYIKSFTNSSSLIILKVEGDSMEPDYYSGEKVLVDLSKNIPSPPGIYAIWDGYTVILKRLEIILSSDPTVVKISSINPAYSSYNKKLDEITIKGRVIGKWVWK
ncbi:XRE family transcriptional regulator [Entomobacter blattae]|uniref:HTH cro/C1-type domain-containing protein n=1 Tax=Entomobacter blattae TaxID=2762277 RepID=A0A7H1NRI8_9PROT|nr:LexA family transcriptional regulator [Entomobacter blattae]QNT78398.1 hypothetical protein JGUZn3_11720 [Entomobacter blattae]